MEKTKLIRITTVPVSLKRLLHGQLRYVNENGFEVIGISTGGEFLKEVEGQEDIRTIPVEMTRTISPLKDLKSVWKLYRIFRKEKPEIVHTHTPKAGTVGMIAAKLAGVPFRLHTVAGLPLIVASGKKRQLLNLVEKITYSCATNVYPNSYGLKDFILKNKFTTAEKLKVIGKGSSNGIDTTYFNPELVAEKDRRNLKESIGIEPKDFIFLYAGRLVKDKGINELVHAFSLLNEEFPDTKLVMIGSYEKELDPLKPETESLIDNNPNILALGFQSDVRAFFSIADVFTFPSYREGFPNVLMQSCAMGVPSIASDINGCNEIIENSVNGMIVPVQDQEKLYEAMVKLYKDSDLRERFSENSRKRIVENYERKYVWQEILKEYKSLMQ